MATDVCCGTGCNFDSTRIWMTSAAAVGATHPSPPPAPPPGTCNATADCHLDDLVGLNYFGVV